MNHSKVSTSLMTCGTASGELLPFYIVYKAGRVWDLWTERGPAGTKYDCSKSGWFDSVTFENWFNRILLPHAKKKNGPKVILCDNLSSHLNKSVIEKCRRYDIKLVFLPCNTTHLTQPLDVAFFAPMKKLWRSLLREWKLSAMGQRCSTLPKSEFPRLLSQVWNKLLAVAPQNLMSGFQKCGIVPADVEVLLNRLPNKDKLTLASVGEGFQKFVEKRHSDMIATVGPKRKRKGTNIVAGLYLPSQIL